MNINKVRILEQLTVYCVVGCVNRKSPTRYPTNNRSRACSPSSSHCSLVCFFFFFYCVVIVVYYNRLFWCGALIMYFINSNNK